MPCTTATCLHGHCKTGGCVCSPGFVGVECHENVAIESSKPLFIAFLSTAVALFALAFIFTFIQLLQALYISAKNKRCTAVPKTLCLVFHSLCTLFGTITYSDPWGYRGLLTPGEQLFFSEIVLITFFLGNYPMWRMWFQLQERFDRSRLLTIQSPLALLLIILLCICNMTTALLATMRVIAFGQARSIINTAVVVALIYFATMPTYFGWKIMKHLDQNKSKEELKAMTILVMGCCILFLMQFVLLIVQIYLLPRMVAYSRTREIVGFFGVPVFVAEVLLVTVTLGRHNSEELKRMVPLRPPARSFDRNRDRNENRSPRNRTTSLDHLHIPQSPATSPTLPPTPEAANDTDRLLSPLTRICEVEQDSHHVILHLSPGDHVHPSINHPLHQSNNNPQNHQLNSNQPLDYPIITTPTHNDISTDSSSSDERSSSTTTQTITTSVVSKPYTNE